jgi:hypothetical protein
MAAINRSKLGIQCNPEVMIMSKIARPILSAVTVLALAGAYPVVHAQSSAAGAGTSSLKEADPKEAAAGSPSASGASVTSGAGGRSTSSAGTANDDKAIENLQAAAQSLRESIQRMAQMPAGEKRAEAIRESNEALMQVQAAMASLPSHLLLANATEADYKRAVDKMKQASDRLYDAADALARQPAGKDTNAAIKQVNKALLETNEAMLTGLQMGAAGSANIGSAALTGRPPANNVDLGNTSGSGSSGGSAGAAAAGKGANETVIGPTKSNDIGVMDSANSRAIRRGTESGGTASATPGK